ncbi:response regulator [Belnapia rosea]|uniref:response regulator n=1 Tax=Belnapia rosea TaxID=938405 RepID=UPI00087F99CA|nr:response regulator [Belnapia rosea]SDB34707.1 Response regulator receiver domain-containing protein [Belnapia rosea]
MPRRILVIEDEAFIAMLMEDTLLEAGYEVLTANNGETALRLAQSVSHLTAVVTGIDLSGGMTGQAVIRSLRQTMPGLPVVVVTGFHPSAREADLRGIGGPTTRLEKPVAPEALLAGLAEVLADPHSRACRQLRRTRAAPSNDGSAW